MRGGQMRTEHPERVQMGGQRAAISPQTGHRLRLGLRQMGLQNEVVVTGQVAAADQEVVAAMQGDGRREAGSNETAVERPGAEDASLLRRRSPHRARAGGNRFCAQRLGDGFDQFWIGLVEGLVGDHRRDHCSDAGVAIGLPNREEPSRLGLGNSKNRS